MGRPISTLPEDRADRIAELQRESLRIAEEYRAELYQLAVVEGHPASAIARAAGVDFEVMKKRVTRIRKHNPAVQQPKAA